MGDDVTEYGDSLLKLESLVEYLEFSLHPPAVTDACNDDVEEEEEEEVTDEEVSLNEMFLSVLTLPSSVDRVLTVPSSRLLNDVESMN